MAYKKLIKVSNVCQLLDKRTFPASGTKNGITYTHNGDGSYTVNGTFSSSAGSYFYFCSNEHKNIVKLFANHKYLVLNGTYYEAGLFSVWLVNDKNALVAESNANLLPNNDNSKMYTPNRDLEAALSMDMNHKNNVDTVNFVFKPQLFDLTEMYGAGHEPTTVEQFRQDFPEEMYDYSPHCFVKSYKNMMICNTKNLFPTSTAVGTLNGFDTATPRQFEEGKWYIGITRNNYYVPNNITEYELTENYVYFYSISAGYGLGRAFKCEPNQTYTISCKWIKTGDTQYIGTGFYDENGNYLTNITSGALPKRFTIDTPANCKWFTVVFSGQCYVYNIQIEKGSTATDFIPNGYIQSYKKSLVCTTKNLFDINSVSNINNWVTSVDTAHPYCYYTFYLKPNTTYTFSRKYASNNDSVYACFSKNYGFADGNGFFIHPTASSLVKDKLSFTTDDTGIMYLNVYGIRSVMNSFIELIEGAQLELGDTATGYVPYGHL